jgi:hypothetical protein
MLAVSNLPTVLICIIAALHVTFTAQHSKHRVEHYGERYSTIQGAFQNGPQLGVARSMKDLR